MFPSCSQYSQNISQAKKKQNENYFGGQTLFEVNDTAQNKENELIKFKDFKELEN